MAEIRSTMEMVLEKAAKLCNNTDSSTESTDYSRDGMRAAAAFLRGDDISLSEQLSSATPASKPSFTKGILDTFLRNLVLPREDEVQYEDSVNGILQLNKSCHNSQDIPGYLEEVKSILSRYSEHKIQLREQLEEQFAGQMAQMQNNLSQQTGVSMNLEPAQHPEFAKEWQNVINSLNDQYGNAIEQYKGAIIQAFKL